MIIKILFENYDLNLTTMLYKNMDKLDLNFEELNVLNSLVYFFKNKKSFSISLFCKKINSDKSYIEDKINSLINKKYISIDSYIDSNNKMKEYLNYDNLFIKLEKLISANITQTDLEKIYQDFVKNIENYIQRVLTSTELLELNNLFNNTNIELKKIEEVLEHIRKTKTLSLSYIKKELL